MISATRRWLRRNRNGLAIAAGAVGASYLAGQYILGKISEARERSNLDRIAKDKYGTLNHERTLFSSVQLADDYSQSTAQI